MLSWCSLMTFGASGGIPPRLSHSVVALQMRYWSHQALGAHHGLWGWSKGDTLAWHGHKDCSQELIRFREKDQAAKKRILTSKITPHRLFDGANLVGTMKTVIMDIAVISRCSIWSIHNDFVEEVDWVLLDAPRVLLSLLKWSWIIKRCCVPSPEQDMTFERSLLKKWSYFSQQWQCSHVQRVGYPHPCLQWPRPWYKTLSLPSSVEGPWWPLLFSQSWASTGVYGSCHEESFLMATYQLTLIRISSCWNQERFIYLFISDFNLIDVWV